MHTSKSALNKTNEKFEYSLVSFVMPFFAQNSALRGF